MPLSLSGRLSLNKKQDGFPKDALDKACQELEQQDAQTANISKSRKILGDALRSHVCEWVLGIVVCINVVVEIEDTNRTARGDPANEGWTHAANGIFTVIYSLELVSVVYVYRSQTFADPMRIMDFIIVVPDILQYMFNLVAGVPSPLDTSVLRVLRLARLARTLKLLTLFPELNMMLRGIVSAFKTVVWGSVLLFLDILVWSIFAVQILHPINNSVMKTGIYEAEGCTRCPQAWASVWRAFLTITKHVLTGEEWANICVPMMEHSPVTLLFFVAMLFSSQLLILNLVLAVTVERANLDSQVDETKQLALAERAFAREQAYLLKSLAADADRNDDGCISIDEFLAAYQSTPNFQSYINELGLERRDLESFFEFLYDEGKDLDKKEFVKRLHRMGRSDPLITSLTLYQQGNRLQQHLAKVEDALGAVQTMDSSVHACSARTSIENETQTETTEMVFSKMDEQKKQAVVTRDIGVYTTACNEVVQSDCTPVTTDMAFASSKSQNHETIANVGDLYSLHGKLMAATKDIAQQSERCADVLDNLETALGDILQKPQQNESRNLLAHTSPNVVEVLAKVVRSSSPLFQAELVRITKETERQMAKATNDRDPLLNPMDSCVEGNCLPAHSSSWQSPTEKPVRGKAPDSGQYPLSTDTGHIQPQSTYMTTASHPSSPQCLPAPPRPACVSPTKSAVVSSSNLSVSPPSVWRASVCHPPPSAPSPSPTYMFSPAS